MTTSQEAIAQKAVAEFHAELRDYIARVETILRVPPGAIAQVEKESGVIAVMKMCGTLEPLMRQAISRLVQRAIERSRAVNVHTVPMASDVQKPIPTSLERIIFAPGHATDPNVIDYAVVGSAPIIPSRRFASFDKVLPKPAAK
jgi:hypothetical protein